MRMSLIRFARMCEAIEQQSRTVDKIRIIDESLNAFKDPHILLEILSLEYDVNNIGQKRAITWIANSFGMFEDEVKTQADIWGDLSEGMMQFLSDEFTIDSNITLKELHSLLVTDCSSINKTLDEYKVVSTLLKDGGIKSQIIKKYVPVINKLINKYLQSMDFYINFTLDEEFNEIIKSRFRDEFSYASFSEGEKQKIDLALLFTWREIARMKNSVATNLLILDEVFDSSLDDQATGELLKILRSLGVGTNVFVISHKGDILVDKFLKTIKFEKQNDFSKMSEES